MAIYIGSTKYSNATLLEPGIYQTKTINPSTTQQTISPDSGYDAMSQITVNAVTSSIDANITAGNIKDGVTILGVTGTYDPSATLTTLNVTPSTTQQTITPTGNIDGWDEVVVAAVTSSIDANITAANIKLGVTILGVTGTYSGGGGPINPPPTLSVNYLYFQAEEAGSTIAFNAYTNGSFHPAFEYSTDGTTWNTWTYTDTSSYVCMFPTITLQNAGDYIFLRGNNSKLSGGTGTNAQNISYFMMTGKIRSGGSIMTLLDATDTLRTFANKNHIFHGLFYGCGSLTTPPSLPATTLSQYCYYRMFYGCGSLRTAPALPALTCASTCYGYMFAYCSSLITPPALPATTLASNCYSNMFSYCTSLSIMPTLACTTLTNSCYTQMFQYCMSLTTVLELPATSTTTASCYSNMFLHCHNLRTVTNIKLSPTTSNVMSGMFNYCINLTYIKVSSTSWNTTYTSNWVAGVPTSGTFHKPSGTTIASGTAGTPSGWTVIDD